MFLCMWVCLPVLYWLSQYRSPSQGKRTGNRDMLDFLSVQEHNEMILPAHWQSLLRHTSSNRLSLFVFTQDYLCLKYEPESKDLRNHLLYVKRSYTTVQKFGVCKIWNMRHHQLHFFDQKQSQIGNIVKYFFTIFYLYII